jgi:hypothetical protein
VSQPPPASHIASLNCTEVNETFHLSLESKFNLTASQAQHVIQDACTPTLFRRDLHKLLLMNYRSWQQNGIWSQQQHGMHAPLSSPVSNLLQRVAHLIRMGQMNENETTIHEIRDFVILHLFLKEFNCLKTSLDNSVLLQQGRRGATAAIDILLCNSSMSFTRTEVT